MSSEIEGQVIANRFPIKRERSKSPIRNSTTKANYASRPTRESLSSRERRRDLRNAVDLIGGKRKKVKERKIIRKQQQRKTERI